MPCLRRTCALVAFCCWLVSPLLAQLQQGSITGVVLDPAGARVPDVEVQLSNDGTEFRTQSSAAGEFSFHALPYGDYTLKAVSSGFATFCQQVSVAANIPVNVTVHLQVASSASVNVTGEAASAPGSKTSISSQTLSQTPGMRSAEGVTQTLGMQPGWTSEDNGLIHVRGIDDGVLYVADGVPIADRVDRFSASPFAVEMFESVQVTTGGVPAEFGGRSGAVVVLQSHTADEHLWTVSADLASGSFAQHSADVSGTAQLGRDFGLFAGAETLESQRFLDPVSPRNFHNRGSTARAYGRLDWHHAHDALTLSASGGVSRFTVPNDEFQQAAGQDQRQELSDSRVSLSWQRIWSPATVTDLVTYGQFLNSELHGSPFDSPLLAEADRHHSRAGGSFALTRAIGNHTLKFGIAGERVAPDESLRLAVTNLAAADDYFISPEAQAFTPANPFLFAQRSIGSTQSVYAQDTFTLFKHLSVQAGLRFDRNTLPVTEAQFSPRLALSYAIARTGTSLRASYGRFFMPPEVENLLLANSLQARQLSPFAALGGGETVRAERSSLTEVGLTQQFPARIRFDAALWRREIRNVADPNVFFNTTLIFPNSVTSGTAHGFDANLQLPSFHGWSAFLNFTHASARQFGPINGGLFLTDDFLEIGPGTPFRPDHDIRNSGALGIIEQTNLHGFWWSVVARHQSGAPLEVSAIDMPRLINKPGASLVNFGAERTNPWSTADIAGGFDLLRAGPLNMRLRAEVLNVFNESYVYNFGNPFSGTHFAAPRGFTIGLQFSATRDR